MTARLSRHTLILGIGNIGGAALSFLLSIMIGRWFGEIGLGQYAVVSAWIFPLALLVEFGLGTLMTRDIAQAGDAAAYLRTVVLARLILGGAIMLLVLVSAPLLSDDPAVIGGLRLSAPLVVILPFFGAFTAVFRARGVMAPLPWLNIGMLVVQVVLTALVITAGGGLLAVIAVNVVTSAGQLVAAWGVYRWRFHVLAQTASPPLVDLLRRAAPFALAAVFAALQMRVNVVQLEQVAGAEAVGYYSAASRFVDAARLLPNALFAALLPALATLAAEPPLLRRTFRQALAGLIGFGLLAALVTVPLAGPVITLTYGAAFQPAVPALHLLMGSLLFALPRGGVTLYLYALGREHHVNVVNGIGIGVQIVLNAWLIPGLGVSGAALTTIISEAVILLLLWGWRPAVRSRRTVTASQQVD